MRSPDRRVLALAVAASLLVGAVAGGAGTYLLGRTASAPPGPPGQVLARADLATLGPGPAGAKGRATVVATAAGRRLEVDVSALPARAGHFYEVWLIDRSIRRMVPVGILGPGHDEFVIPNGVQLGQYPVVDVSVQLPGDPRHSGVSVLRGTIAG